MRAAPVIITTFLSLVITLVGFEIWLRQTAPRVKSRETAAVSASASWASSSEHIRRFLPNLNLEIQNHFISHESVLFRTNSLGFRGPELLSQEKQPTLRLMVLGDSITSADYLPEEDGFVGILGKTLKDSKAPSVVEIVNAGVPGVNLESEVGLLKETVTNTKPQAVLVMFYLNDAVPLGGFFKRADRGDWMRRYSVLLDRVYRGWLARTWLAENRSWLEAQNYLDWAGNKEDFLKLTQAAGDDWGNAWKESAWGAVKSGFVDLKSLASENNFQLCAAILPVTFQVVADVSEDTPQQLFRKLMQELGVPSIDLLPGLRSRKEAPLFYDWCHPTRRGHVLIANALKEFVLEHCLANL